MLENKLQTSINLSNLQPPRLARIEHRVLNTHGSPTWDCVKITTELSRNIETAQEDGEVLSIHY